KRRDLSYCCNPPPHRDYTWRNICRPYREPSYNLPDVSSPSYRFGPFIADRVSYRVLRGDRVLDLTPKLLDLLFHLLNHSGALVTKDKLLEALWPGANVTENALAQAMSDLRHALGDDAGEPRFIKTIARRGYRFIAPVEIDGHTQPSASPNSNQGERR